MQTDEWPLVSMPPTEVTSCLAMPHLAIAVHLLINPTVLAVMLAKFAIDCGAHILWIIYHYIILYIYRYLISLIDHQYHYLNS